MDEPLGDVSRDVTCQSVGITSIGLDEFKIASSERRRLKCATRPAWPEQDTL
jgi:hypothetical protein